MILLTKKSSDFNHTGFRLVLTLVTLNDIERSA